MYIVKVNYYQVVQGAGRLQTLYPSLLQPTSQIHIHPTAIYLAFGFTMATSLCCLIFILLYFSSYNVSYYLTHVIFYVHYYFTYFSQRLPLHCSSLLLKYFWQCSQCKNIIYIKAQCSSLYMELS